MADTKSQALKSGIKKGAAAAAPILSVTVTFILYKSCPAKGWMPSYTRWRNILLSDEILPFPAQPVIRDDFINLFQFSKISRLTWPNLLLSPPVSSAGMIPGPPFCDHLIICAQVIPSFSWTPGQKQTSCWPLVLLISPIPSTRSQTSGRSVEISAGKIRESFSLP